MKNELLTINNVSKHFGSKLVLNNLSLKINRGEVVALIGPNGSGKTTLIRTILNLYNDNIGDITILNKNVKHKFEEIGPYIGTMIEESGIYELLTPEEYLKFILSIISNKDKDEICYLVKETLKKVNLYDKKNERLKTFSKGMIQRTAFARAIINNPLLLILDEPFDGIDIETKSQLISIIKNEKEHRGVLITSHNLNEIENFCDRIAIIKNGSILFDGTPEYIRNQNKLYSKIKIKFNSEHAINDIKTTLDTFKYEWFDNTFMLHIQSIDQREDLFRKIKNNNLKIDDIYEEKVSLEEVYLNLINK